MSLPVQTVRKLLRDHFTGEEPIRLASEERGALGGKIEARLGGFEGVKSEPNPYVSPAERDRLVLRFSINDPDENRRSYYHRTEFRLLRGDAGELLIHGDYGGEAKVSNLGELDRLILACQERLRRRQALAAKRQKIRGFKAQAIIARVKKLAAELEFDFMTRTDTQKLKLFVRLADDRAVELHIPFSKFEQVLPELKTAIGSLLELHATGISFKVAGRGGWGWGTKWISYREGE